MNLSGDHQHPFETWNWICLYLWLHYTGNCKSPVGVPDFKKVNDNNVIQIPLKKCTFDNDLNGWHSIAIFVVLKCFYQICGGFLKKRLFCVWKCQTTVMFQDLFSHKYRMICVDISQNAPIATAGPAGLWSGVKCVFTKHAQTWYRVWVFVWAMTWETQRPPEHQTERQSLGRISTVSVWVSLCGRSSYTHPKPQPVPCLCNPPFPSQPNYSELM